MEQTEQREFVIETEGLTKKFGKKCAVDGLNLRVPRGSVYAFLGPNGAGKTTTIQMVMNILEPTSGESRVFGRSSGVLDGEVFGRIGYVSENQHLPEWMTVRQYMDYCRGMYPKWDEAFYRELQEMFELPEDQKLGSLSRGMKGKAALLSSLAYRPELLILDEPFSGLDPVVRDELVKGVLHLSENQGWTVLVSSHDIEEVEQLADWVGILNRGKLELSMPIQQVQESIRCIEVLRRGEAPPPVALREDWVSVEHSERVSRIVTRDYREGETEARLREVIPDVERVEVQAMPLREIFVAYARGLKSSRTRKGAEE